MKEFLNTAKAFSIAFEQYFAESIKSVSKYPHIMVGFYYENDGTEGEFKIEWNSVGIQLKAFNDSWEALSKMPELLELMGYIDSQSLQPTIEEFAELLKGLGYKDITERERPEDYLKNVIMMEFPVNSNM